MKIDGIKLRNFEEDSICHVQDVMRKLHYSRKPGATFSPGP
jgi:hypothetical protein